MYRKQTPYSVISIGILLICGIVWMGFVNPAITQSEWTTPVILGERLENSESWFPRIAADPMGNVHVVWNTWDSDEPKPSNWSSNAVYYTKWDGSTWSRPVDIFYSSELGRELWAEQLVATNEGELVLLLRDGTQLGVATAQSETAGNPRSWERRLIDQGRTGRILIDENSDDWYLAYQQQPETVFFMHSEDKGRKWSTRYPVWSGPSGTSAAALTDIAISVDGSIHLTWAEHSEESDWNGTAIWHARIKDLNTNDFEIREAARVDRGANLTFGSPSLTTTDSGEVIIFWNNGVGSATGRFYQLSTDNGETWQPYQTQFPSLSGQTNQAGLVADNSGGIHLVTAADGDGFEYGIIRYTSWEGDRWRNYDTLWPQQYPGEHPAVVIASGNQLHLVWDHFDREADSDGVHRVVYASRSIDAKVQTPNKPIPLPPDPVGQVEATASSMPYPAAETKSGIEPSLQSAQAYSTNNNFSTVALGVGASILFLLVVVIAIVSRKRA